MSSPAWRSRSRNWRKFSCMSVSVTTAVNLSAPLASGNPAAASRRAAMRLLPSYQTTSPRHGRPCCLARGDDRHLSGDMADTFVVGQVNVCDLVGAEEDPVLAIAGERSDGDALTSKRLRDFPEAALKADVSLRCANGADDVVIVVFNRWQPIRHRASARPVAVCGHVIVERGMRPIEIVDGTPRVEGPLHLGEIAEVCNRED